MHSVTLLAFPDVDDLDLIGALSILSKASASVGTGFFRVAAACPKVRAASGVQFDFTSHWIGLDVVTRGSAVILPGGPGAAAAALDPELSRYLTCSRALGARMYAICTGTLLLARNGLLAGRHVAMHHCKRDLLDDAGCVSISHGLVRDGWLTTVGGDRTSSCKSIDLAMQLLRDIAPDAVPAILERMELVAGRRLQDTQDKVAA